MLNFGGVILDWTDFSPWEICQQRPSFSINHKSSIHPSGQIPATSHESFTPRGSFLLSGNPPLYVEGNLGWWNIIPFGSDPSIHPSFESRPWFSSHRRPSATTHASPRLSVFSSLVFLVGLDCCWKMVANPKAGGETSNIFYFQPENCGNDPFWWAYFSDGLV